MTRYLCRKDGVDLTAQVERATSGEGGHVVTIDVFTETSHDDRIFSSGDEVFITPQAARERSDLVRVEVTCPKDEVKNIFWVRRANR